jgi:hypothetical protein
VKFNQRIITVLVLFTVTMSLQAELPGEGPRLGHDRISQAEIESGDLSLREIRLAGLKMFSTPFNKLDGYGDGPMNPLNTTDPGGRPTLSGNGTFLRVNGLDGQTCLECHSIVSNASVPAKLGIGGVGGSVTNAIFQPTFIDVTDSLDIEQAAMDGRFINPPFLFGSGGVELLAKEMTTDLQGLKQFAQQNPGMQVQLETKGVHFGQLVFDGNEFDLSGIEGIDGDLVVRPFGRKGEFATVRGFDDGAMMFHFGMQPVEIVGENVDADADGVINEVLIGELSALVIFNTTLERPVEDRRNSSAAQGSELFTSTGCANCHMPLLTSNSQVLTYSFPEVEVDPSANIFYEVNLARASTRFRKTSGGGIEVPLYADLKRHDMGSLLAETFGSSLDTQFTTARLWGVADTAPYLHDGRALTLGEAILLHGGEAQLARDQYAAMVEEDKAKLLEFLLSLRTPANPATGLSAN